MDSTENVPAKIQAEAKARALKVIESNPGCQSYVRPEDLDTAALFIPVVSVIKPTPDDFYPPIPKVGIMGKPQLVNLLKEKAGINITRTETEKRGDYVYCAHVWGDKRQPDGSMLTEDASYEFDCNIRAELDFISDPKKYRSDIDKRKHVLELAKFGNQRAVTGAQHSLIHKLAHVARSFKTPEELMKGMIVSRIDRNINGMLADPAMQKAMIDHALGATETVFGASKQIESQPITRTYDEDGEKVEKAKIEEGQLSLDDDFDDTPAVTEMTPIEAARSMLEGYREKMKGSGKALALLEKVLADKASTIETINSTIDRFETHLQKQKESGAA